jgi:hypothetical protein
MAAKKDNSAAVKKAEKGAKVGSEKALMRKAKTMQITGDHAYDKDSYIKEVKFFLSLSAEAIIEVGYRLLVIKEMEKHGHFMDLVQEEIGIPYRTAARFMHAALKSQKYPQIDFSKFDKLSNLYTLLEAPEEDLKELEREGVMAGYDVSELSRMSIKDMRSLIKKLKSENDKIVKSEVKAIEAEKRALIKENERLKKYDPDGKDAAWVLGPLEEAGKARDAFDKALRNIAFDDRVLEDPSLIGKVEAGLAEMRSRLATLDRDWAAFMADGS